MQQMGQTTTAGARLARSVWRGGVARPPAGKIVLTYDDYARLPNDGRRYEIINGDIFMSPAPQPKHQDVVLNLARIMGNYLASHPVGKVYISPIDLILSDTQIVQPDLLYLSKEKRDYVTRRGIEGPPDLIVEVLSPATGETDRTSKARLYARFGITHYWLIDPDKKCLEPYHLLRKQYRAALPLAGSDSVTSDLFPGLTFPVAGLWR